MSKKDEVRAKWLELAMQWYDALDEQGRREMFERTSKTASTRWTVNELETAMTHIRLALDASDMSRHLS